MKLNSLFCGGGGLDLGFIKAGFEVVGAWDYDTYAVMSYKHNIGDHVKQADISKMKWSDLLYSDVLSFGFPCTDLSVAGRKAGLDGKKSGLFFQVMRLLRELKENNPSNLPKVLLAENVKGLRPYLSVLEDEYEKAGYKMYYTVYNSKHFGLAQSRERYFVVGVRKDIEGDFVFPEQSFRAAAIIEDILEPEVDEKFFIDDDKALSIIGKEFPAPQGIGITVIGQIDIKGHDILKRVYDIRGLSPTLNACEGGNRQPKVYVNGKVRKLSPREFARLQGFSDDYEQIVSNSQFYKQMGNAVSTTVSYEIACQIRTFLS